MPRPVHFEIHADDLDRARDFYTRVFGWEFSSWGGPMEYWLIKTGTEAPGIDGGMIRRQGPIDGTSVIAYVVTMDVPSVDEYAEKVQAAGGQIVVPKMPIPGVGWLVYAKDTEGNIFGLHQADPAAG